MEYPPECEHSRDPGIGNVMSDAVSTLFTYIKGHELLMVLGISKPLQPQRISQSSASADTCQDVKYPLEHEHSHDIDLGNVPTSSASDRSEMKRDFCSLQKCGIHWKCYLSPFFISGKRLTSSTSPLTSTDNQCQV